MKIHHFVMQSVASLCLKTSGQLIGGAQKHEAHQITLDNV